MKVNILNKELIKPSTPTPPNLKNYSMSCIDNLFPVLMSVPIILFYESSPTTITKNNHLQDSLAKILPQFYPFAGRYIAEDNLVDCSDQGAEFIEARVAADDDGDLEMMEFIKEVSSSEQLDVLLPDHQEQGAILTIQVTMFKCGGAAIGVCIPHKFVDAASVETFVAAWANASCGKMAISPVFYSPPLFPCSNPGIGLGPQLSGMAKLNHVAKKFVFNKEVIASLKAKIGNPPASQGKTNTASRVRVVCAFIAKALIRLERAQSRQPPRQCQITQAFNIRERTIPPLPKHSCGSMATAVHCKVSDNMGFEELVEVLAEATAKPTADCADILCSGESNVHRVLVNPIVDMFHVIADGEMNAVIFSDWTRFRFYDADFGWGKPVWTSIGTMGVEKFVVLMENTEGDGVEAWVHLNHQDMAWFEHDEEMRSLLLRN